MLRIPLAVLRTSPETLAIVRQVLADGGIAAIPTETFYAFAVDPFSEKGVRRVFEIKGRDDGKALSVLFSSREQLSALGLGDEPSVLDRYFDIWPAPLSVILPLRAPIAASRGGKTLAVRLPAAPAIHFLLNSVGPLTGTSANRSGDSPFNDPSELEERFKEELDVIIDGGRTPGGRPSTLIDATTHPPTLLRDGAFPWTTPI